MNPALAMPEAVPPRRRGRIQLLLILMVVIGPMMLATAMYKFSFKETILVGALDRGSLVVETFDNFTDGSGRSDYYSKYYLCKH